MSAAQVPGHAGAAEDRWPLEPGGAMPRGLPACRRPLQALVLVLVTAYATVLLYQAVAPRQVRRRFFFPLFLLLFVAYIGCACVGTSFALVAPGVAW